MKSRKREADKRIRDRRKRRRPTFQFGSWQTWQAIATIGTAITAAFGVYAWSLEAPDRQLERTANLTDTVQKLYAQLDELSEPELYPRARLNAGFVIQKLGELGQPVMIVGDEITIERADISCVDNIEIFANKLNLVDVEMIGSRISTTAQEIYIARSVFLDTPFDQTRYFGPPISSESEPESIVGVYESFVLGASKFRLRTEYLDFAQTVSEASHFIIAVEASIRNSFFLNYYLKPQPISANDEILDYDAALGRWSYDHVGVVFTEENWDSLGLEIDDSSKRISEIALKNGKRLNKSQRNEMARIEGRLNKFCKYSAFHEFSNPPECPPYKRFVGQFGEPLLDGPFGLDQYFANSISEYPYMFGSNNKSEMAKLKELPLGDYFKPPFIPKSLSGFEVIDQTDWTRCPSQKRARQ